MKKRYGFMRFYDEMHKSLRKCFVLNFKQRNQQIKTYWLSLTPRQQYFILCDMIFVNEEFLVKQMQNDEKLIY